jgi:hypothetical protein
MDTQSPTHLPTRLNAARRQFDKWRLTRNGRSRIPAELWALAVKAAQEYGVYRTVRALGIDYTALKKRLKAAMRSPKGQAPSFVELLGPAYPPPAECVLELENHYGARLRIHLRGEAVPDVAELTRRFSELEP